MRFPNLKVVLLTGSCGKTSTKEMLRSIFEKAYGADHVLYTIGNTNNQIGVPQNLLRLSSEHRIAILEAGSNHPGEIEPLSACAKPDYAVLVSIANCHLEFFGSIAGVANEKAQLFSHLAKDGIAVYPAEGPETAIPAAAASSFRHYTFGFSESGADLTARYDGGSLTGSSLVLTEKKTGRTIPVHWSIPGRHNAGNAAAAAMIPLLLGIPERTIADGLSSTVLPGFRMRIKEHGDSIWINDAYNANPDSMSASLSWLSEFADPSHLILVVGDMGELGAYSFSGHYKVCSLIKKLFPTVKPVVIGPRMGDAAAEAKLDCMALYPDSASAAKSFYSLVKPGSLVFLKASRSTGLDQLEPAEEV